MVTSQNTRGSLKRPAADDDEVPKKPAKKMAPKKASFAPKPQTPVSSQDVSQLSFATSADQSSSVVTPSRIPSKEESKFSRFQVQPSEELESVLELEPRSPISPRPPINKTWETFGDQILTDYLSSANNMAEYKNGCRYFHARLSLIARGFSIDELKNIFNATLPQFLEDDEEYNQKTACRTFEDKYDWVTDWLIERIRAYAQLWIASPGGTNYSVKYLHAKKQKKSSVPYPPIPDSRCIKIYISKPCLEWKRLQIVDLFLSLFLSIKTSPNEFSNNISWIKGDKYDRWYRALDILGSSLIVKVAKLLVDAEAASAAAQKDKGIMAETEVKAQKELFRPAITKLLRTHITFAIDSPDFSQAPYKRFFGQGKNNLLLQPDDIIEDQFALSTRIQEEMEANALEGDLEIEESEREIWTSLDIQYARDVIKLQAAYGVQYKEDHNFMSLQTPALVPEDKSALGKAYISKGPVGRILMVRHDIQRERKRLNTLLIAAHRYDKILDWELAVLAEEEEFCRSTEEALKNQWKKNREKEALVKQKRIAANAPIFNPKSTSSTSLPSSSKPTSTSTATTTSPVFSLIEELSDNDDENMEVKDTQEQKQEEDALELAARTLVSRAGPPGI
ncbi:hypothetical protein MMC31_003151 [Peltigera leucophlebia]|nr:hypothetical protein [Peltigera leucophlebia]